MNDMKLALRLLATYKDLGFTEDEIEVLCKRGYELEKDAFRLLHGVNALKPEEPKSEEEIGHYLGSWAWALPGGWWPLPVYNSLKRQGVTTVGLLQMITEERLAGVRNIGTKSIKDIKAYMEVKGFRFSKPNEAMRTRVATVFGNPWRLPISYIKARTGVDCGFLADRGINRVMQLTEIPEARLRAIPRVGAGAVSQIRDELQRLGLTFK